MKNENKIFWGRTLAVQEFEDYSRRDFDRPQRDSRSGMIPPKLAKIMINLARAELDYKSKNNITLLDPFCGSGTILQEAAILGVDKLIGGDLSKKAAEDSRQNLKWLEEYKKLKTDLEISIFNSDVRKISELISESSVDLIVTEPYLGPPLTGKESENRINQIVQELSKLYLSAFEEFKKILKKSGCVCMVWPVFYVNNKFQKNIFLPIFDKVKEMGFRQVGFDSNNYTNLIFDDGCRSQLTAPAPQSSAGWRNGRLRRSNGNNFEDEFKNFKKNLSSNFSERGNIIYGREGQMVKREIAVFKL